MAFSSWRMSEDFQLALSQARSTGRGTRQEDVDFALGAGSNCGGCKDGWAARGVMSSGASGFSEWTHHTLWAGLNKEEEGEEMLSKPMGWFPTHEQASEQRWFALVFGCRWMFCSWVRRWMPKSKTITMKEIVINLPYLSLLRTKLYVTLHRSTKLSSTAAVC